MVEDKTKKEQNNNSVQPSAEKTLDKNKSSAQATVAEKSAVSEKKATAEPEKPANTEKKATAESEKPANAEKKETAEPEKPVNAEKKATAEPEKPVNVEKKETVKLNSLFAFKMSMSTFYNEKGESIPVTALKYEPCFVSQIKTEEKESYSAVQVAFKAQKNKRCSKALIKHLTPAGFKEGARFVREIRQTPPEGIKPGQELSIESVQKGDLVKISALSKGRGFTGVMKRWNFAGGKASHGSKAHRRTGSIGQHTEPARVFPGRKMPGHYGFQKVSRSKVPVVDVLAEEGIIFVKGSVPGARNTLVSIQKI